MKEFFREVEKLINEAERKMDRDDYLTFLENVYNETDERLGALDEEDEDDDEDYEEDDDEEEED